MAFVADIIYNLGLVVLETSEGLFGCWGFLIPYLLLISLTESNLVYGRYLLPVLPLIFLLASFGIMATLRHYGRTVTHHRWTGALVLLLVIAPLVPHSWAAMRRHAQPNTRMLAKAWIEERVAENSTILLEGGREHRSQYLVPLYNRLSNIDGMIADIRQRDPGKARYWELKRGFLADLQGPRYDLQMVMRYDPWPDFAAVKKSGVDYVVVETDSFSGDPAERIGMALQSRRHFYSEMLKDADAQRVVAIVEDADVWGPGLEIFSLKR
ncbi:MAG: hypothetical protein R2864_09625 [Syntrophotaleaceae bacterium]